LRLFIVQKYVDVTALRMVWSINWYKLLKHTVRLFSALLILSTVYRYCHRWQCQDLLHRSAHHTAWGWKFPRGPLRQMKRDLREQFPTANGNMWYAPWCNKSHQYPIWADHICFVIRNVEASSTKRKM